MRQGLQPELLLRALQLLFIHVVGRDKVHALDLGGVGRVQWAIPPKPMIPIFKLICISFFPEILGFTGYPFLAQGNWATRSGACA